MKHKKPTHIFISSYPCLSILQDWDHPDALVFPIDTQRDIARIQSFACYGPCPDQLCEKDMLIRFAIQTGWMVDKTLPHSPPNNHGVTIIARPRSELVPWFIPHSTDRPVVNILNWKDRFSGRVMEREYPVHCLNPIRDRQIGVDVYHQIGEPEGGSNY